MYLLLSVVVYNLGCLVALVVYVELFPPVLRVVDVVHLSVVLTGQDVEQVLRLPGQEGQPVLE